MITLKNKQEIAVLRKGREIVQFIVDDLFENVVEGATTADLDQRVESLALKHKVKPAFKGYMGFAHCICASPNQVVVHGIPNLTPLCLGDVISIDMGIIIEGLYLDTAYTFKVGEVSSDISKLLKTTRAACLAGIDACSPGAYVQEVSKAIEAQIKPNGYGIVRQYVGHGVGYELHEDPQIPNYDTGKQGPRLEAGMTIAIEPMVNLGTEDVYVAQDGWAVCTRDESTSAHYEHTVLVTDKGPEILTYWPQESSI